MMKKHKSKNSRAQAVELKTKMPDDGGRVFCGQCLHPAHDGKCGVKHETRKFGQWQTVSCSCVGVTAATCNSVEPDVPEYKNRDLDYCRYCGCNFNGFGKCTDCYM